LWPIPTINAPPDARPIATSTPAGFAARLADPISISFGNLKLPGALE
jgi:hypothetical protein